MTVRIVYQKHFMTGNLAGMAVESGFNVSEQETADIFAASIRAFTKDNPKLDISGNQFYTSSVRTEPL